MSERIIRPLDHIVGDPRHIAPWGTGESIVDWQSLQSRVEGKTVSGVYYLPNELPKGWEGIGFEFPSSEVLVVMAVPVIDRGYRARLLIRWIEQQSIWTPGMTERHAQGKGRASHLECDVCKRCNLGRCPGHQVQGETIRGFIASSEPTSTGGQVWLFEFTAGMTMRLLAEPDPERAWAAELELQVLRRGAVS
jgi:hypothetical protein